ncbi:MAG: class I SAM-dependent methyltransferase [Nitrososphaerota archaeon]|nr:class I SAM-dependent methyltransferase [Nitrososphaerota archaeon]
MNNEVSDIYLKTLTTEFESVQRDFFKFNGKGASRSMIGGQSRFVLFSLVRILKPNHVLETGVDNGVSSYFILRALESNRSGRLSSTDVSPDCGSLLGGIDRGIWDLHLLKGPSKRRDFTSYLRDQQFDVFIHDSNHSYTWQLFEYESVLKHMNSDSLILSDDVDSSYAFIDFSKSHSLRPSFLFDKTKFFGGVQVNQTGRDMI